MVELPFKEIKLFGKWDLNEVKVEDYTIAPYIALFPLVVPHRGGRYQKKHFGRAKHHIVERLAQKLMVTGHLRATRKHIFTSGRNTGKKLWTLKVIEEAFDIIHKRTGENPVQVLIRAIENAAPRAEVTTVEYGGIRTPVAVDVSPLRRVDLALSFLTKGAAQKAIKSRTSLAQALAEEIMLAANNDNKSFAIDRKTMLERQAEASR